VDRYGLQQPQILRWWYHHTSPDQTEYVVNQTISASGSANEGTYLFADGDLTGDNSAADLRVDGPKSVIAVFHPVLTIDSNTVAAAQ